MYVRPRTPRQQCSYALARYTVRSNQYIYRVATAALSPARTCHNIYSHTSKSQLRISSLLTNQRCNPLVPYPRPDTLWLASYWLLVRRPHNHSYALAHCQPLIRPDILWLASYWLLARRPHNHSAPAQHARFSLPNPPSLRSSRECS